MKILSDRSIRLLVELEPTMNPATSVDYFSADLFRVRSKIRAPFGLPDTSYDLRYQGVQTQDIKRNVHPLDAYFDFWNALTMNLDEVHARNLPSREHPCRHITMNGLVRGNPLDENWSVPSTLYDKISTSDPDYPESIDFLMDPGRVPYSNPLAGRIEDALEHLKSNSGLFNTYHYYNSGAKVGQLLALITMACNYAIIDGGSWAVSRVRYLKYKVSGGYKHEIYFQVFRMYPTLVGLSTDPAPLDEAFAMPLRWTSDLVLEKTTTVNNDQYTGTSLEQQFAALDTYPVRDVWDYQIDPYVSAIDYHSQDQTIRHFFYGDDDVRRFDSACRTSERDLFPLAHFSSVDALDKYTSALGSNMLESLSEASELGGLVSTYELLKEARKVKISKGFKHAVDAVLYLLASGNLIYRFALRPTKGDIEKIFHHRDRLRSLLQGELFRSPATIYGSHSQNIETGRLSGTSLVVRSKIRVQALPDTVLYRLVTARSVGLLPSLSNIWGVIPFSFVVDWVFPVGSALEMVDNSAFVLMWDVEPPLVHSVLIERPLELFSLPSEYETESYDGRDFGYRYYQRFLSSTIPLVAPSRILLGDFQPRTPDWSTVGSLGYLLYK